MDTATFFYNGFNVCLAVRDVKIIIQCNLHGVTAYNFIFMNFFSVDSQIKSPFPTIFYIFILCMPVPFYALFNYR